VCKWCHTVLGKCSRMSIPGKQKGLNDEAPDPQKHCFKLLEIYIIWRMFTAYLAVLTVVGLLSLFTRAFATVIRAVLKQAERFMYSYFQINGRKLFEVISDYSLHLYPFFHSYMLPHRWSKRYTKSRSGIAACQPPLGSIPLLCHHLPPHLKPTESRIH